MLGGEDLLNGPRIAAPWTPASMDSPCDVSRSAMASRARASTLSLASSGPHEEQARPLRRSPA